MSNAQMPRNDGFVVVGTIADDGLKMCQHFDAESKVAALFHGRPKVFFLAICQECNAGRRPLPMPFGTETARDTWAEGHRTTGHHVDEALEIRPNSHG